MTSAKIMVIESGRASAPSFAPSLEKKGYTVQVCHKVGHALALAEKDLPDLIVLDAASMKTSGTRMCRRARSFLDGVPIILVVPPQTNPDSGSGASLILVQPFTPRKLHNRIVRLLPGDENYNLEVGPIKLNLAQYKVRSHGKETRLTPKQARLLEVFMKDPGRLMSRTKLIRKVWQTDYTGDTRTLDVHMSWLRRAVEPDPKQPRYLKTIRGMGYRLDVPEK
ncbi:MAG: response regulator transcription factor [Anaerolineales bacterium]|nr:response regulator transcription factor [Anaerolineales bacterium]